MEEKRTIYQCVARGCDGCTVCQTVEEWDVEHDIIRIGNLIGCDLCKKGDEIRNDPVCVPKMKAFRLSARTEVLNSPKFKEALKREYLRGIIDSTSKALRLFADSNNHFSLEKLNEFYDEYLKDNPTAIAEVIKRMMNEK